MAALRPDRDGRPSDDPLVGSRVREYEILDVVGKGGMGAVYRARHVYLDELRAIKVIHSGFAKDRSFLERFIREARVLSRLRSPYLVQLYEFGTVDNDTFFMVMELVNGESALKRLRARGRLSVPESVKIVRQAALGLGVAHQRDIVHRDISPDNLMLVQDEQHGEVTKVIDFGIAKPLMEQTLSTLTNAFVGKLEYSSPEQCGLLGESEQIDARSDVYSLGVTLYHLVTGQLPFQSNTPQGFILKHATEPAKPPSVLLQAGVVPPSLDRLVLKALAKDRKERYATMAEMVEDLDQIATDAQGAEPIRTSATVARPRPGLVLAKRYRIEAKLGEGGMGAVYRVHDQILDVPVALKVITPQLIDDAKTLERLKREVILARRIAHPNVCRIHDIGESDGVHYISMDYIDGRTMSEVLPASGPLDFRMAQSILGQVLDGLEAAHREGIVHRDLKPGNIMVSVDARAYVMDFGLSLSLGQQRVTQTGMIVGTPQYMAPEQISGGIVDHRADIYAMGVMMFRTFTGQLPFEGRTGVGLLMAHMQLEPPRPSSLVPSIPESLDGVILKALAKNPTDRYQGVDELVAALGWGARKADSKWVSTTSPTAVVELKPHARPQQPQTDVEPQPPSDPNAARASQEVSAARRLFLAGKPAEALARLEAFKPPHTLVDKALSEIREEMRALEAARKEDERRKREAAEKEAAELGRKAEQEVLKAKESFAKGDRDGAISRLASFEPRHALTTAALEELKSQKQALEAQQRQEAEARRRAEEAERREKQDAEARAAEWARKAQEAVKVAKRDFSKGEHDKALALLRAFAPPHPQTSAALGELLAEKAVFDARRQKEAEEAEARRKKEAEERAAQEVARKAEDAIKAAKREFGKGDREGALARLKAFQPPHPLVTKALQELVAEKAAYEERERLLAEERQRKADEAEARRQKEAEERAAQEAKQRAQDAIKTAKRDFAKGDREGAIGRLKSFAPPHPLVTSAIADLGIEKDAAEAWERQQAEERQKRQAKLEEEARLRREAEETALKDAERKAAEAVKGARNDFAKGQRDAAIAKLAAYAPQHVLTTAALAELRAEKAEVEARERQEAEEHRKRQQAKEKEHEARRRREAEEAARKEAEARVRQAENDAAALAEKRRRERASATFPAPAETPSRVTQAMAPVPAPSTPASSRLPLPLLAGGALVLAGLVAVGVFLTRRPAPPAKVETVTPVSQATQTTEAPATTTPMQAGLAPELQKARSLLSSHKYEEARREAESALEKSPGNAEAATIRDSAKDALAKLDSERKQAARLSDTGRTDEAVAAYSEILKLAPGDLDAQQALERLDRQARKAADGARVALAQARASAEQSGAQDLARDSFESARRLEAEANSLYSDKRFALAAAKMGQAQSGYQSSEAEGRNEAQRRAAASRPASPVLTPPPPTVALAQPPESAPLPPSRPSSGGGADQAAKLREQDRRAVQMALDRYVQAMEAKDLNALRAVFPSVSERTVRDSFQFSRSIEVRLTSQDVKIDGDHATVVCQRHDEIVTADGKTFQKDSSASFSLKRQGDSWNIDSMAMR